MRKGEGRKVGTRGGRGWEGGRGKEGWKYKMAGLGQKGKNVGEGLGRREKEKIGKDRKEGRERERRWKGREEEERSEKGGEGLGT